MIVNQVEKEFAEFFRDKFSVFLAILLPLLTMLLFAYGVRLQSHQIPLLTLDRCNTALSREYLDRVLATNLFSRVSTNNGDLPEKDLQSGRAKALIELPEDFETNLLSGKTASPLVLIDASDIINARLIKSCIDNVGLFFPSSIGLSSGSLKIHANMRFWFNPGLKESLFIVPGVFGIVLWIFPSLLACISISKEKEDGTLVQLLVSKISARQFILGKAITYVLIAFLQAAFSISIAIYLFQLRFQGSPLFFFMSLLIYIFSAVLFGLAVGSFANSQSTAVQAVSSLGFFTSLLLSGFVYPLENIPYPLSLISYLVPARYFIELSRNTFELGLGLSNLWMNPLLLLLFCLLYYSLSYSVWKNMQFRI
ncbi:MAG: ABC transporter permease [Candidatus Obscuribacterales bacterium]|nr:ABC transporter permease [Candidatus Obscuribacterales bacterium]